MIKLKIEKLVEGGQGIAHDGENTYFVWNALPGEEVEAEILNKRKGIYECLAVNNLKPSPHRIEPNEEHFLSCSPWAIMDVDFENNQKREIAIESYKRIAKLPDEEIKKLDIKIFSDGIEYGFRNKMEFSFVEGADPANNSLARNASSNDASGSNNQAGRGKISFAFFKRGQKVRSAISGCVLATDAINKTAQKILDWINSTDLTMRNMKSLIVRSNMKGETIAGLFIKDRELSQIIPNFHEFGGKPVLDDKFIGFNLYYSTHKSPASVISEVLYQEGQDFLIEEVAGKKFKYGINSFFQVNIPVFEMALADIADAVSPIRDNSQNSSNSRLIDFYSGVGVIGISVGANVLVESNQEAVSFASENVELNKVKKCDVVFSPSEKALKYIEKGKTIVFDPPRAGLHTDVTQRILEVTPARIIYLSCNVATQARDFQLLGEKYDIKFLKLYNFFPHTPHTEALAVLDLKK